MVFFVMWLLVNLNHVSLVFAECGGLFKRKQVTCPLTPIQQNFSIDFLGHWFEMFGSKNRLIDFGDCVSIEYYQTEAMLFYEFGVRFVKKQQFKNGKSKEYNIPGQARLIQPDKREGRTQMRVSKYYTVWYQYDIIQTDYSTYAIMFYCDTYLCGTKKSEHVYVFTRRPLDEDEDREEFMRIKYIVLDVVKRYIPGFDFENEMKITK